MAGRDLLVLAAVFISITVASIVIRVFTRLFVLKNMGADDYLICAAAVFAILCSVASVGALSYGLGGHIEDQKPEDVAPYQKLVLTSSVGYSVAAMFIKLSLLTFYLRLSSEKSFLVPVYIGIFVITGFGIGSITAILLQCIPLSMLWDPNQPGSCFHLIDFYYANAALNIATDVTILLIPVKILWGLHMPVRQRISLCALFSLGSLACVASIIRLATLKQLLVSTDPTWVLVTPINWSTIELHTAIFVAGAPALKAFLRRYVPTLLGSSHRSSNFAKYGSKARQTHRNSIPLSSIENNKGATKWPGNTVATTRLEDNESQEHIYQSYHVILQEVTVTVASERRS